MLQMLIEFDWLSALQAYLWQGVLIAALAWTLTRFWPGLNAATRYSVWSMALGAMILLPIAWVIPVNPASSTTSSSDVQIEQKQPVRAIVLKTIDFEHTITQDWQVQSATPAAKTLPDNQSSLAHIPEIAALPKVETQASRHTLVSHSSPQPAARQTPQIWIERTQTPQAQEVQQAEFAPPTWWQKRATWQRGLMLLWGIGFALFGGYILLDLIKLRILKSRVKPMTGPLANWFVEQATSMDINRPVILAGSHAVASPMAIGFIRPHVLIPEYLWVHLDGDALKQVLAHELAHVRRNDDWHHLFQRVIMAALFWHPAAWFVFKRLAFERELACDDWAVRDGKPQKYARSLVRVYERLGHLPVNAGALGAAKFRSQLGRRVEHLTGNQHQRGVQVSTFPILLAICSLFGSATLLAWQTPGPKLSWSLLAYTDNQATAEPTDPIDELEASQRQVALLLKESTELLEQRREAMKQLATQKQQLKAEMAERLSELEAQRLELLEREAELSAAREEAEMKRAEAERRRTEANLAREVRREAALTARAERVAAAQRQELAEVERIETVRRSNEQLQQRIARQQQQIASITTYAEENKDALTKSQKAKLNELERKIEEKQRELERFERKLEEAQARLEKRIGKRHVEIKTLADGEHANIVIVDGNGEVMDIQGNIQVHSGGNFRVVEKDGKRMVIKLPPKPNATPEPHAAPEPPARVFVVDDVDLENLPEILADIDLGDLQFHIEDLGSHVMELLEDVPHLDLHSHDLDIDHDVMIMTSPDHLDVHHEIHRIEIPDDLEFVKRKHSVMKVKDDGYFFKVGGEVHYNTNGTDVVFMGKKAVLVLEIEADGETRRIEMNGRADGTPFIEFFINDEKEPYDPEGRQFLEANLPVAALYDYDHLKQRTMQMVQDGGPAEVFDFIAEKQLSHHLEAQMMRVLLQTGELERQHVDHIMEAASQWDSSHTRSQVYRTLAQNGSIADLEHWLPGMYRRLSSHEASLLTQDICDAHQPLNPELTKALLKQVPFIDSNYERTRSLWAIAANATNYAALHDADFLNASLKIESDYELSRLWIKVIQQYAEHLSQDLPKVLDSIQSNYEASRILDAYLSVGGLDLAPVWAGLQSMDSNHDRAKIMVRVARHEKLNAEQQLLFLDAAAELNSDYDRNRVLQAFKKYQTLKGEVLNRYQSMTDQNSRR